MADPKEFLTFVQLDPFVAAWKRMRLTDDDLRALESLITADPDGPPVVPGTGGVREVRFSSDRWSRGKSGGARVYFSHFPRHGIVALVFAHAKNVSENIPQTQRKSIKATIDEIHRYLDRR